MPQIYEICPPGAQGVWSADFEGGIIIMKGNDHTSIPCDFQRLVLSVTIGHRKPQNNQPGKS